MSEPHAPKPKNVLLLISDQHRWDYSGYAGADWLHTPNLDALAARGTVLEQVYSTSPLCAPQRISITTGRYPMNSGCFGNRHEIDPDAMTFLQRLQKAGVQTAQIGKLHHFTHGMDADFASKNDIISKLGYDTHHETSGKQGAGLIRSRCNFTNYLERQGVREDYWKWVGTWSDPGEAQNDTAWPWEERGAVSQDEYITQQVEDFIAKVDRSKPFYLHAGIVGPHPPFDAPERYREHYQDAKPWYADQLSEQELSDWRAYCACISEVDEKVGRIVAALEKRGLMEDTVLIYTSDHGEMGGERGRWHKGPFYEPSAHVPWIAAGCGIPEGRSVKAMGELIDIGKTACDLLGVESHVLDQGYSLAPVMRGETDTGRPDAFCEMGSDKMLFDGRYKLMFGDVTRDRRQHWFDPPHHGPGFGRPVNLPPDLISLYDLEEDPREEDNLADKPECQERLNDMIRRLLIRLIANTQDRPMNMDSVL